MTEIGAEWKSDKVQQDFLGKLQMYKPWTSLGDMVTLVISRGEEPARAIPRATPASRSVLKTLRYRR